MLAVQSSPLNLVKIFYIVCKGVNQSTLNFTSPPPVNFMHILYMHYVYLVLFDEKKVSCELAKTKTISFTHAPYF